MDGLVGGLVDGLTDYLSVLCRFIRAISRQPIMKCNDARAKQLSVSSREQGVFITFSLRSMAVLSKFAREARENERRSRENLARLYYLATKTAMLRRLL